MSLRRHASFGLVSIAAAAVLLVPHQAAAAAAGMTPRAAGVPGAAAQSTTNPVTVSLTVSSNPVAPSAALTVTAGVTDPNNDPTGAKVVFCFTDPNYQTCDVQQNNEFGEAFVVGDNGTAEITSTAPAATGTYAVFATYYGTDPADGVITGNDSNHVFLTVANPGPTEATLNIADTSVREGNHILGNVALFPVTLSSAASSTVTATAITVDGTATRSSDYLPIPIRIRLTAGQTRTYVPVVIIGDRVNEPDETLHRHPDQHHQRCAWSDHRHRHDHQRRLVRGARASPGLQYRRSQTRGLTRRVESGLMRASSSEENNLRSPFAPSRVRGYGALRPATWAREPSVPASEAADDRALSIVAPTLAWFEKASSRSNRANIATDILTLLTGAATTVAAAVQTSVWVTAPLAGLTVVLTGAKSVFHFNDLAARRTLTRERIRSAIARYRVLDAAARTQERRQALVEEVGHLAEEDASAWARWRRQEQDALATDTDSLHPAGP